MGGDGNATLWHRELDTFVACATQGVDGFEHRPLVRGGGLDVVICTPDVSATFLRVCHSSPGTRKNNG